MLSRPQFILGSSRALFRGQQQFHTSPTLPHPAAEPSHYETLKIHETATRADIKKRFYELSKSHHPDRTRTGDKNKFIEISGAYQVLSDPAQRQRYDRELLRRRGHRPTVGHVGGRPASGLSRRSPTPKGPPRSYYRNTGWAGAFQSSTLRAEGGGMGGGMGVNGGHGEVKGFDLRGKQRMHEAHEERRNRRRKSEGEGYDTGIIIPIVAVTGILGFTVWSGSKAFGGEEKR